DPVMLSAVRQGLSHIQGSRGVPRIVAISRCPTITVCRIPKSGAIIQEVQETLRDQDSLRKWTASQPAVGGPYIRMSRQWTPGLRDLPVMGPLSEPLLVYILPLTNKSNTSEAICVYPVKDR